MYYYYTYCCRYKRTSSSRNGSAADPPTLPAELLATRRTVLETREPIGARRGLYDETKKQNIHTEKTRETGRVTGGVIISNAQFINHSLCCRSCRESNHQLFKIGPGGGGGGGGGILLDLRYFYSFQLRRTDE